MNWHYVLVFLGAMLVDIVPLPLPPAFTVMVFFQIKYDLNIWFVIGVGIAGSMLGRYILTLYFPYLSGKIFSPAKNHDVEYLGSRMKQKRSKSWKIVLIYSLMPLPTTPLFIAAGMAKMRPDYIIPPFIVGKIISNTIAVFLGDYAAKNTTELLQGALSWKSIAGLVLGLAMLFAILFVDWETLLLHKKLKLKFHIWR